MERDTLEFDIMCVGCGVATLSTVLSLLRKANSVSSGSRKPPSVLVLDKGPKTGAHVLSGAVVDTRPLLELLGADELAKVPKFTDVRAESFRFLTENGDMKVPWVPPAMQAEGFPIVSLSAVTRHLAGLCEKAGAEIYAGFSAVEFLREGNRITGVRLGDKGVNKHGARKSSYMPGADIKAKVVVLGEGACGYLTEQLLEQEGMRGANPQSYAVGIKEVIETPERKGMAGTIMHTFGYPLGQSTYGGGFVYCLSDTQTAIGLITALDYANPTLSPHEMFRLFKLHPAVKPFISGGHVTGYGAKTLPEGGFNAVPQLVADGAIIVGDAGGLLDTLRLKGVHLAVESGIVAGDTLFECWKSGDYSRQALMRYPAKLHETSGWKQLKSVRNMRASFKHGMLTGLIGTGLSVVTGGILPPGRISMEPDWESMDQRNAVQPCKVAPKPADADRNIQLDRLSDLYFSKTHHEEDQPSHLKIPSQEKCRHCIKDYGAPCTLFCPAQVYNLSEDGQGIKVDFSNCLHCKTCQIKDPLENIRWTPPEAGGGPGYSVM